MPPQFGFFQGDSAPAPRRGQLGSLWIFLARGSAPSQLFRVPSHTGSGAGPLTAWRAPGLRRHSFVQPPPTCRGPLQNRSARSLTVPGSVLEPRKIPVHTFSYPDLGKEHSLRGHKAPVQWRRWEYCQTRQYTRVHGFNHVTEHGRP